MKFQRCWNYIQQRRIHSVPIILSCIYDLVYRGGNIYVFARDSSAPSLSPFKLYFVHPIANVKVNEQIIFLKFLFPSINRLSTKQLYRSEISAYLTPGFEGWDGRKSRRDISRERFQREKLAGKLASSPSPPPQFRFSHNLSLTMMLPPHRQLFSLLQSEEISGGRPFSRPSVDIPREKRTASVSVSRILADEETRRSRLSLELTFPPPANNYHHHHLVDEYGGNLHEEGEGEGGGGSPLLATDPLLVSWRDADSSASVQEFRVQKCENVCENIVSRKIRSFLLNRRNRRRVFDDVLYGMDLQFETRVSSLLSY